MEGRTKARLQKELEEAGNTALKAAALWIHNPVQLGDATRSVCVFQRAIPIVYIHASIETVWKIVKVRKYF